MQYGWQKEKRLLKRAEFTLCYDQGYKVYSRNFLAFIYTKPEHLEQARVGLAVSKKVGNAVARNRVKRLLREFCRLNQSLLPPFSDIVIMPKKHLQVKTLTYAQVEEDLSLLFHKIFT